MLVHWVWLASCCHINDTLRRDLVEHFGSAEDVYRATKEEIREQFDLKEDALCPLLDKNLSKAQEILGRCHQLGIWLLTWEDETYPAQLRRIEDPPMVLYGVGTLPDLEKRPAIGVVGTRKASAYGLEMAREFGYQISAGGGILVSGLAVGIDGLAMEGALQGGNPVIGVLAFGPDHIYPRSNERLFDGVKHRGCLLSEYAPGVRPDKWTFPRRNRIISGLSQGVLIVEAPEKSGALITAHLALEQGRDVFCVPGAIRQGNCAGSNELLRSRVASAAVCGYDVLSEYESRFPGTIHREKASSPPRTKVCVAAAQPVQAPEKEKKSCTAEKSVKKTIDYSSSAGYIEKKQVHAALSHREQILVDMLQKGPVSLDELLEGCGLSSAQALSALTMLEIRGVIVRSPDRQIRLK